MYLALANSGGIRYAKLNIISNWVNSDSDFIFNLRTAIEPGNITLTDLLTVFPFYNKFDLVAIDGKEKTTF